MNSIPADRSTWWHSTLEQRTPKKTVRLAIRLWGAADQCTMSQVPISIPWHRESWWRHQMETFSALLAICAGNSPVPGEFPTQRPVTRSFDVYFDLRPNKRLSKQWWGWWFETQSWSLWHHRNEYWNIQLKPHLKPHSITSSNTPAWPYQLLVCMSLRKSIF